eukprot:scpid98594/ scgid11855/ 
MYITKERVYRTKTGKTTPSISPTLSGSSSHITSVSGVQKIQAHLTVDDLLDAEVDKALQESTPAELEALERPQVPPASPASSCVSSENSAKFIFSGNFAGAVHIHVHDVKACEQR